MIDQKNRLFLLGIFFLTIALCSCSGVVKKMYGIKEISSFDSVAYTRTVDDIKKEYAGDIRFVVSNPAQFRSYAKQDSGEYQKSLRQPIQILYFQADTLASFHANCYAKGGLSNLDWNFNKRFETFIPKSAIPVDSVSAPISGLRDIYGVSPLADKTTVVLFWTNYLEKISKSTIAFVLQHIKDAGMVDKTRVVIINTDKFFIGLSGDKG